MRTLQTAKRLSLSACVNPEVKAWALAHVPQDVQPHSREPRQRAPCEAPAATDASDQTPMYHRLCGFIPTEQDSITPILSVLHLDPDDVFYDLGCGDGRMVVSMVKHFRCRGVGIDVNRLLLQRARSLAEAELVSDPALLQQINFIEDDIINVSLSDAKMVYIYMPNSALHIIMTKVLPHCGLQDGTCICIKDNWVREEDALRNCRYTSSHWGGGIHCYKWQRDQSHSNKAVCSPMS